MVDGRLSVRQLCSRSLSIGAIAVVVVSCTSTDNTAPMTRGGPGDVVTLNHDAGRADGPQDAGTQMTSTGGHGGGGGHGPGGAAGAGSAGSAGSHPVGGAGGAAGAGGAGGAGGASAGGAAGGGPPDDPCTACEKAHCKNPDLSMDIPSSGYIPHDAGFGMYTFEVLSSRLQPGCAESAIVNGILDLMPQRGK